MASYTHVFADKETTNWFKAYIALNITKEGLRSFVELEIQNVHRAVGISCGNCSIENILQCPTPDICRNSSNCNFHSSPAKQHRPCHAKLCDKVKQNIESHHRYEAPSWLNTKAESWPKDHWQIAKCFLPRDGYLNVPSAEETDFNGMITVLINCTDFEKIFSSRRRYILTKARQVGRDVRHTSNCKVTDADLRDYFHTLSTLLGEIKDPSAKKASDKLCDLRNEILSISEAELCGLVKDAIQTLTNVIEEGKKIEQDVKKALSRLKECFEEKIKDGETVLEMKTNDGLQKIAESLQKAAEKTKDYEQKIGKMAKDGTQTIGKKTTEGVQNIDKKVKDGNEKIGKKIQNGVKQIREETHDKLEEIEVKATQVSNSIESKQKLCIETINETAERRANIIEQTIYERSRDGSQNIQQKIDIGEQRLEEKTQEGIDRIEEAQNEASNADYAENIQEFIRRMKQLYEETFSNASLSILDPGLDKPLTELYVTPCIRKIYVKKDGTREKGAQVYKYKDILLPDYNSKKNIFLQGEPGRGKSTFAAKLVLDWCNGCPSPTLLSDEQAAFDDVKTLQKFKFLFHITLRESRHQRDVSQMVKTQIIDMIYAEDEREKAYQLFEQIRKTEVCFLIEDGLDEWVDPNGELVKPLLAGFLKENTVFITTRPWKMIDERIKNSQIDSLLELDGLNDPSLFSERILSCLISDNLAIKIKEFTTFASAHGLQQLESSPVLYALIICTWVEGRSQRLTGLSSCTLHSVLLESLCRKVNHAEGYFDPPPVACFTETAYLQPNIEQISVCAKASFQLLFSQKKEMAVVFDDRELSCYMSMNDKEFALKSGILTRRKTKNRIEKSFSFIHTSIQAFLAAYHIATTDNVIDEVVSEYLDRIPHGALHMSQIFIFLCGMNIDAANAISGLFDQHSNYKGTSISTQLQSTFIIGYKEAKANQQKDVHFHLTEFLFSVDNLECNILQCIWMENRSNSVSLFIESCDVQVQVYANDVSLHLPSLERQFSELCTENIEQNVGENECFMLDLSSCHNLETLHCRGSVTMLPNALHDTTKLKTLIISCKCVINDLSSCQYLEHVSLGESVTLLPNSLGKLKLLKVLKLYCEYEGWDFSSCHCLESVNIDIERYKTVHPNAFNGLYTLKYLWLKAKCDGLDLSTCLTLQLVHIFGSVTLLPNALSGLKNLRFLQLYCKCDWLDLLSCQNLESLDIGALVTLLPNTLPKLKNLKDLSVSCTCSAVEMMEFLYPEAYEETKCKSFFSEKFEELRNLDDQLNDIENLFPLVKLGGVDTLSIPPSIVRISVEEARCSIYWLRQNFHTLLTSAHCKEWRFSHCQFGFCESQNEYSRNDTAEILVTLNNTVVVCVQNNIPGLWEALSDANIKSLGVIFLRSINFDPAFLSQTLQTLKPLNTLRLSSFDYIDFHLPPSLVKVLFVFDKLSSSSLRHLLAKLTTLDALVRFQLIFGYIEPLDNYLIVKQKIEELFSVDVNVFNTVTDVKCTDFDFDDDDNFVFGKKCPWFPFIQMRCTAVGRHALDST